MAALRAMKRVVIRELVRLPLYGHILPMLSVYINARGGDDYRLNYSPLTFSRACATSRHSSFIPLLITIKSALQLPRFRDKIKSPQS